MKNQRRIRIVSALITAALSLCATFTMLASAADDIPFTDVSSQSWYYGDVVYCYQNGLMSGVSKTEFAPDSPITRGMLVTMLHKLVGTPEPEAKSGFSDVSSGWYYNAVYWAKENGVVSGFPDGTFAPDRIVTRQEFVVILYQFEKEIMRNDVFVGTSSLSFADNSSIADWARGAVLWSAANKIVSGTDGNRFAPNDGATRAQGAAILHRYAQLTNKNAVTASGAFVIRGTVLLKYNGADAYVEVPDGIKYIEADAFRGNTNIRFVKTPNTTVSIADNAFRDCKNLEAVIISESLNELGANVFYNTAENLAVYGVPKVKRFFGAGYHYVGYAGSDFYYNERGLLVSGGVLLSFSASASELEIPNGTLVIHNQVFRDRTGMRRVGLPDSLAVIEYGAFRGCSGLRYVVFPESLTTLGDRAFYSCTNLKAAFVSENLTGIGEYVFFGTHTDFTTYGTRNALHISGYRFLYLDAPEYNQSDADWEIVKGVVLQYNGIGGTVAVPDGAEIIARRVLEDRTDITAVSLPDSLRVIDDRAFYNSGLVNIDLPDGLLTIGDNAFYGSSNLKTAHVPGSVTSIGANAFWYVNANIAVTVPAGSIAQGYFTDSFNYPTIRLVVVY
jgi:hypothetical protein